MVNNWSYNFSRGDERTLVCGSTWLEQSNHTFAVCSVGIDVSWPWTEVRLKLPERRILIGWRAERVRRAKHARATKGSQYKQP